MKSLSAPNVLAATQVVGHVLPQGMREVEHPEWNSEEWRTEWMTPFGRGMALGASPGVILLVDSLLHFGLLVREVVALAIFGLAGLSLVVAIVATAVPRWRPFGLGTGTGLLITMGMWFIAVLFSLAGGSVIFGG